MKKKFSASIALALISVITLTGCSLFRKEPDIIDTDPGVFNQSSGTQSGDQTGEGQGTETDPVQDLLDEIDNLNLDEDDANLPEWLVEAANQIDITVTVINMCGVDIGMVSTIDPYTEEQMDLGSLPADQIINISETWPRDKTTYDLAIYNMAGDLVSVTEVDITGITEKLTITLSGDGDLSDIKSEVE